MPQVAEVGSGVDARMAILTKWMVAQHDKSAFDWNFRTGCRRFVYDSRPGIGGRLFSKTIERAKDIKG